MDALVTDLHDLAKISFQLVRKRWEVLPTTTRSYHGAMLFVGVARFLDAISHYGAAFESTRHIPTEPLATLVRGLVEAADVFHYHYLDPRSDEESQLRLAVRGFHHDKEEREFREYLGLQQGDFFTTSGAMSRWMAENRIRESPAYASLSEVQQREIRKRAPCAVGLVPGQGPSVRTFCQ